MGIDQQKAVADLIAVEERIKYLVSRKFPGTRASPPLSAGATEVASHQQREAAIKAYEAELRQKPLAELLALWLDEMKREEEWRTKKAEFEERQRFYNKREAMADFATWGAAQVWTVEEAIALSLGKNPAVVNSNSLNPFRYLNYPLPSEYFRRKLIADRATDVPKGAATEYVRWMQRLDFNPPAALVAAVGNRGEIRDWRAVADELQARLTQLDALAQQAAEAMAARDAELAELRPRVQRAEERASEAWQGFDEGAATYPPELDIAVQAWRAASKKPSSKQTPKQQILSWLNAAYPSLSSEAMERIATVCNWSKAGGAPKKQG